MSVIGGAVLSKDEIEEELLNSDLLNSGGIEDQDGLQDMNVEEKKNLLKGIQQSKEDYQNEAGARSLSQSLFDTSSSNFPSLPPAGKTGTPQRNRLKLPRKSPGNANTADSDTCDQSFIHTDKEETIIKFKLPYYIDDGAPPLQRPEGSMLKDENPYYVMENETPIAAFYRILKHHDEWKAAYEEEMRRKTAHLHEDTEESVLQDESPKSDKSEEKENDPYEFDSISPLFSPRQVYGGAVRRREPAAGAEAASSRTLQRKASRDSDCEEVETILKPETPKLNEWITATSRQNNKRKGKQLMNTEKAAQTYEPPADVEFDFVDKWDARTSTWRGTPGSGQPRRLLPQTPVVDEEKVQCPICQQDFRKSKVEAHAATCEGYSPSYMDVEENS